MSEPAAPGIDPETLERLRRGVPLRLTAMGQFRFDDEPVSHPGVQRALREGLDVTEDGEPIVRLGPQWCYLTVDDTLLRATAVQIDGETARLRLDDGRLVTLDPSTLWEEPGRGLRATVASAPTGRPVDVRFTNRAQLDLAPHLGSENDHHVLVLGEHRRRIPKTAPQR